MSVHESIKAAMRINGRVTAYQMIHDYGLPENAVYAALRKGFQKGEFDRRLIFVRGVAFNKSTVYQYWLAEDPEGIN